jgi:hypothetical protein
MRRLIPALTLAAALAAGCSGASGASGGGQSAPPAGTTSVAGEASQGGGCTQSTATGSGLSVHNDFVTGTVTYSCTGTVDHFSLTLILIHNGLHFKPGNLTTIAPPGNGTPQTFTVFAPCQEGTWQLYMIVVWIVNGVSGYNPQTTFDPVTYSTGDCQI